MKWTAKRENVYYFIDDSDDDDDVKEKDEEDEDESGCVIWRKKQAKNVTVKLMRTKKD